jgi:hypothetical protein
VHLILLLALRIAKHVKVELFLSLIRFCFFVKDALAMYGFACADGDGNAGEEEIHCLAGVRYVWWF